MIEPRNRDTREIPVMTPQTRFTAAARPLWPDAPHTIDPEAMHPRAVEMAQAMREGVATWRDLRGAGFSEAELTLFAADARSLATTLSARQARPGGDLLAEMAAKAGAAIASQPPLARGASPTQAACVAWGAYCRAVAAYRLDPWPPARERCLSLLSAWLERHAALGPARVRHVADSAAKALDRRAGQ